MTDAIRTIREALEPFAAIYEVVRHNPDPVYQGDVCRRSVSSIDFKGAYEALALLPALEQAAPTECGSCGSTDGKHPGWCQPRHLAPTDEARNIYSKAKYLADEYCEHVCRGSCMYDGACQVEQVDALKPPTPPSEARDEARKAALDAFEDVSHCLAAISYDAIDVGPNKARDAIAGHIEQAFQSMKKVGAALAAKGEKTEPENEHSHPCDDCQPEALKEFNRGVASIKSVSSDAHEAIRLIDKIANDSGGPKEYKMNRIWHITQQYLNKTEVAHD